MFDCPCFLGFLDFSVICWRSSSSHGCFEVCGTKIHSGDVFSHKGGPFLYTILFFGIFRIFKGLFKLDRGLFELDMLL